MPLQPQSAPKQLPTLLRLAARRIGRRPDDAPLPATTFRRRVEAVAASIEAHIREIRWVELPAGSSAWTSVDSLPADSTITLLATGEVQLSRLLGIGARANASLWYRLSDGRARKITDNGHSLCLDGDTRLDLIATTPGEFATEGGDFGEEVPRAKTSGSLLAAVIVWQGDAASGLRAAAEQDPALFATAAEHPEEASAPGAWRYLWRLGEGRIYQTCSDADDALCCHTHGDVGILQHPVSLPLDDHLRLRWQWLVEQLPSALPEHTEPTHDYLSIAVEFDNGLDLTYMWSAALPPDTIFQCPLAWWDQRETHWVIRSDPRELGQWLAEERRLLADYETAIGGTPPTRVVGVWLIANSLFQRGVGRCRYRDIALVDGTEAATPVPLG